MASFMCFITSKPQRNILTDINNFKILQSGKEWSFNWIITFHSDISESNIILDG